MKWVTGAFLLIAAVIIWAEFSVWMESTSEATHLATEPRQHGEPMQSESATPEATPTLSTVAEVAERGSVRLGESADNGQPYERPVYTGEVTILGEPADPNENIQGKDTYTGKSTILGEPSDPNESGGIEAFTQSPVQLGEYSDPSASDDTDEDSFVNPVKLGEYSDPDEQFSFPSEFEGAILGEPAEPDDP